MKWIEPLQKQSREKMDFQEKRPGIYQLIAPFYHEDGDMLDVFLEEKENKVRICDYGMTLMRLSYTDSLNTPLKEKIFSQTLIENQVNEIKGNLYMDIPPESLYPGLLQFVQTIAKVSNIRLYKQDLNQGNFFENLEIFIENNLRSFSPISHVFPIQEREDLEVDFQFFMKRQPLFLFGVEDKNKARLVTISCLEFQRRKIPFKSLVVHEDFENINRKDQSKLTSAVDKQFPSLEDFKQNFGRIFELEAD